MNDARGIPYRRHASIEAYFRDSCNIDCCGYYCELLAQHKESDCHHCFLIACCTSSTCCENISRWVPLPPFPSTAFSVDPTEAERAEQSVDRKWLLEYSTRYLCTHCGKVQYFKKNEQGELQPIDGRTRGV